jgi:hypothetical protein
MSIRAARLMVVVAAGLAALAGCTSSTQLASQGPSDTNDSGNGPPGILSGLWGSKTNTSSAQPPPGSTDTTGTVKTPPAEPGPSGEPVAPLAAPGLLGDTPDDDLQQGKRYFRANNFGLAEKSFRAAAGHHPGDAEAWVGLASTYDRLHRFDLADRAYAQAIRLIGPTPEILNDQGFSYMLRGDYARAREKLMLAQKKDPANPYVRANLELLEESAEDAKAVK